MDFNKIQRHEARSFSRLSFEIQLASFENAIFIRCYELRIDRWLSRCCFGQIVPHVRVVEYVCIFFQTFGLPLPLSRGICQKLARTLTFPARTRISGLKDRVRCIDGGRGHGSFVDDYSGERGCLNRRDLDTPRDAEFSLK